jgi:hypothetical protein
VNVALVEWSALIVSVQMSEATVQSPDQPAKCEPAAPVAVSVTEVPGT